MGFEPKTNGLKVQCSTTELYTFVKSKTQENGNWTHDLLFPKQIRYQTTLLPENSKVKEGIEPSLLNLQFNAFPLCYLTIFKKTVINGDWTHNNQSHNLILCHLSYNHQFIGIKGIEPSNTRIKNESLTTWRHSKLPKKDLNLWPNG